MNKDFEMKIKPFFWVEQDTSFDLCLSAGDFKYEIFLAREEDGFLGNGYDWGSLARVFVDEKMPELKGEIDLDGSEAGTFVANSTNAEALQKFALGFRAMCDDDAVMSDLFSRAELD